MLTGNNTSFFAGNIPATGIVSKIAQIKSMTELINAISKLARFYGCFTFKFYNLIFGRRWHTGTGTWNFTF